MGTVEETEGCKMGAMHKQRGTEVLQMGTVERCTMGAMHKTQGNGSV